MTMDAVQKTAAVIRDIGLIIGVPVVLVVGFNLYNAQLSAISAQNDLLKETQYDKALALIKAQEAIAEHEKKVVRQSVRIVNEIMAKIEVFNNRTSLPPGREEEYISEFETDIKDAAERLRTVQGLLEDKP